MKVRIIGNGITGVSAALTLRDRQPDWDITLISAESDFFYSRPALMYIYMGHMRFEDTKPYEDWFWGRKRIERVRARVSGIDPANKQVLLDGKPGLPYDKLLIATGSTPNKFGWPGQDLDRVQGFYGLQDLESLERNTPGLARAVIVGGGLIGIELAEMLHTRGIAVTLLVREPSYWANIMPNLESSMLNDLIRAEGIDLRLQTEMEEILDDGQGRACAVTTKDGDKIECQLVGLTAGVRPNLSALGDASIDTGRGILVNRRMETSVPDVYAAGDCAEIARDEGEREVTGTAPLKGKNIIEQVWYTGKAQGEIAGRAMAGEAADYQRGIWYNSAKFLDLEWHTYGHVTCGLDEGEPGTPTCMAWMHPGGRHSLRITHADGKAIGVNALGLRYRHRVCERWIAEGRTVDYVLDHLGEANFDPEFFRRHEAAIVGALKEQLP